MEELKHGAWERIIQQHGNVTEGFWTDKFLKCSVCGYERKNVWTLVRNPNYCEECGSDMRGKENGQQAI